MDSVSVLLPTDRNNNTVTRIIMSVIGLGLLAAWLCMKGVGAVVFVVLRWLWRGLVYVLEHVFDFRIEGEDLAITDRGVVVMGNSNSSSSNDPRRLSSRYDNTSSSSRQPQQSSRSYTPYENPVPPPPSYPPQSQQYAPKKSLQRRFSRKYSLINDNFSSVEQVQQALGESGLESSNLIVGIDFTKSNEWTGKHSFLGRSLHAIGTEPNPYEKALAIIGKTLSKFDEDNLIPCFGFGDSTTHDKHVFSFNENDEPCEGFEEALARYRTIVPHLRLAGPTSFAPIINAAVDIVEESEGQYHVLIIIAGWFRISSPFLFQCCSAFLILANC